jgi:hypothetical protein
MTPDKVKRSHQLIESIEAAEKTSLEAVRRFLDTVDEAFPHVSAEKPRRKVIDAAFEMTEHLVRSATCFAENIVDITQKVAGESERTPPGSTAKRAGPTKAAKASKSVKKTSAAKKPTSTR